MAELVTIYHPETNEPFELIESKATELRLNAGWLAQPFTVVPEEAPAAPKGGRGRKRVEADSEPVEGSWRDAPAEEDLEDAA